LKDIWSAQAKSWEYEGKSYEDWKTTSAGWKAFYEERMSSLQKSGAQLDSFGNLIIKNWKLWGEYIADSQGYSLDEINKLLADENEGIRAKGQEMLEVRK
jgi:hypothetical protein